MKRQKLFFFFLLVMQLFVQQTFARHIGKEVEINAHQRLQTIQGWGVSLCWWAKEAGSWDDEEIDRVVDWLVSPDGLNYNVFRYNIPGGDDPQHRNCWPQHMKWNKGLRAEMKGFRQTPDSEYDWDADSAQIKVLKKIIARCRHYGKEPIIEAFANTPPWWMTVSGCASGAENPTDTNLHPDYYEAFAQYLIDVCQHFREEGIEFHSLEPFNEPNTNYWNKGGSQEGCGFRPQDQARFIRENLAPKLSASGLKTILAASDETDERKSLETFRAYDDAALQAVAQWNVHTYNYEPAAGTPSRNESRVALRDKVKAKGQALWMSETGAGGRGISGNLGLAKMLFDDIRYLQPVVWCDWQYIDSGDQWCLLTCAGNVDRYLPPCHRNKNFFLRSQISGYITPGYTVVETSADDVLAAVSPDDSRLVVCLLNQSREPEIFSLNIKWQDDAKQDNRGSMTLQSCTYTDRHHDKAELAGQTPSAVTVPARSIVTLVLF